MIFFLLDILLHQNPLLLNSTRTESPTRTPLIGTWQNVCLVTSCSTDAYLDFFSLKVYFSKMPNLNIFDPHLSPKPFSHLPANTALLISPSHFPLTLALPALCGKKICAVNTVWHFLTFHELITLQIIKHVHICNKRRQNGCQRAWLMTSLRLDLMRPPPPHPGQPPDATVFAITPSALFIRSHRRDAWRKGWEN